VSTSITQLPSRVGSYATALAAFRAARVKVCVGELNGLEANPARLLEARAHLRISDPESALSALAAVSVPTGAERAEQAMLAAATLGRLGRASGAEAAFAEARAFGISAGSPILDGELAYYTALAAVGAGDLEQAHAFVEESLEALEGVTINEGGAVLNRAHVVARLNEMLVVIDASRGRYRDVIRHSRSVWSALTSTPERDVFLEGHALKNLAIVARDFTLDDAEEISERVAGLAWTPELSTVGFVAFEATSWCAALRGDLPEAFWRLRSASAAATSIPERLLLCVDRALLAREAGYDAMAKEEIRYALSLVDRFEWEHAPGDLRVALPLLAQVVAPVSAAAARRVLNRYSAIGDAIDVRSTARSEARFRAEVEFSHGVVLRAEGRLDESSTRLCAAFQTWTAIGHEWRAAIAAIELAELRAGDVFRLAVRRELSRRPTSFFASRARAVA